MRVCHGFTAQFDDPNLVSCAGLAPVLQLAEWAGLGSLVGEHVHLAKPGGANAHLKVSGLVAGMVAGPAPWPPASTPAPRPGPSAPSSSPSPPGSPAQPDDW